MLWIFRECLLYLRMYMEIRFEMIVMTVPGAWFYSPKKDQCISETINFQEDDNLRYKFGKFYEDFSLVDIFLKKPSYQGGLLSGFQHLICDYPSFLPMSAPQRYI